jgi:hypothetical protein
MSIKSITVIGGVIRCRRRLRFADVRFFGRYWGAKRT